jgi:tetratricopeptide (TPR) repeat protein
VEQAEATFRKAVEMAPRSVSARLALASFLWARSRASEAETVLKDALAIDPRNLPANRALGVFYMATNRVAAAEPFFKTIAETTGTEEAQLSLADYYLLQNRVQDSRAILAPLTKTATGFAPASLRLAAIQAGEGNRTGAFNVVRDILGRTPKYAPARVFEMRLFLADGKLDEAMAAAAAIIKDEPGNSTAAADAHFVTGAIDQRRDRTEEALKSYTEALQIQPRSPAIALALAQLHLRLGNADKAETYARPVVAARPGDPAGRVILVRAALSRNDLEGARAGLTSLERDFPTAPVVWNLRASLDLSAGRLDAARTSFMKVAASAPNDLEALAGLVTVDLRTGRIKDATDRVDAALGRLPADADLLVLAARAHVTAGNTARAEELLKQAVEREPSRLAAYGMLGQLYARQNRLGDAVGQYRELLKRNPRSIPANTMLGMILEAQRDLSAAEQQYQHTLNLDPAAAVAANNLAWLYVASNRNLDQALQLAQTAFRALPEEPHVNDTLGWVYYRKGMVTQAVRHLELSVSRDSKDPTSHYHLGMAYFEAGEVDKARKALKTALGMSTEFEGADDAKKTLAALPRLPGSGE